MKSKYSLHESDIEKAIREGVPHARIAKNLIANHDYDLSEYESIRTFVRKMARRMGIKSSETTDKELSSDSTWSETEDGATFEYTGEVIIKNLKQALDFCKVDLEVWRVDKQEFRTWTTTMRDADNNPIQKQNYYCKLSFARKSAGEIDWEAMKERVNVKPRRVKRTTGSGVICVGLADLHIGAKVQAILKTPDYSYERVKQLLSMAAQEINSLGAEKVYLMLVGDYIETFTGVNHPSTWTEIERNGYGSTVLQVAHNILVEFFGQINNLEGFYMVAGNHDRIGKKQEDDPRGQAAQILHWTLSMALPELKTDFHPILLVVEIDGICYLLEHDHQGVGKQDAGKVAFKHGRQDMYNLIWTGHWHSRRSKKVYHQVDEITIDECMYGKRTLPSIFSGNFYSASLDLNSNVGFAVCRNNGRGYPIYTDYTL